MAFKRHRALDREPSKSYTEPPRWLTVLMWLLLHSRSGYFFWPCYASREDLGMTPGIGRAKVSRQLGQLRQVGLLFEVGATMPDSAER